MGIRSKVFVIDDHPLIRMGYRLLIEESHDLFLCGEAGSASEAAEQVAETNPDIVLVDLQLPGLDGIELLTQLRQFHPGMKLMVVSAYDENLYAEPAIRAGATGYLMKTETEDHLLEAIHTVLGGGLYLSKKMRDRILRQHVNHKATRNESPVDLLTEKERAVFTLLGKGMSTRQIASSLKVSVKTIESYYGIIRNKLAVDDLLELTQYAALQVHRLEYLGGVSAAEGTVPGLNEGK